MSRRSARDRRGGAPEAAPTPAPSAARETVEPAAPPAERFVIVCDRFRGSDAPRQYWTGTSWSTSVRLATRYPQQSAAAEDTENLRRPSGNYKLPQVEELD